MRKASEIVIHYGMNKLIIGLLALSALSSAGWAMYERSQKQRAVESAEVAQARLVEAENLALLQRLRAEELREESEKHRQMAEEARRAVAECMSKRR
jgi:Flp pilus assembly protein CpaB